MNKFIFLFFSLILFSCASTSSSSTNKVKTSEPEAKKYKTYLALGDSYTVGESVSTSESFPYLLVKYLNNKKKHYNEPLVIAKTGWRTDQLLEATNELSNDVKYDLVTLLIGVNNQYQKKPIGQFKNEFNSLLQRSISFSKTGSKGVVVFSIPDYSVMPAMEGKNRTKIAKQLNEYNKLCKTICTTNNVEFYNITGISREAIKDKLLIASDNLHPSGLMYRKWIKMHAESIVKNHTL